MLWPAQKKERQLESGICCPYSVAEDVSPVGRPPHWLAVSIIDYYVFFFYKKVLYGATQLLKSSIITTKLATF